MATVRDLVKGSMRLIGAIATGENMTADELADGISALNDMLDSWSNEGLVVHARVREEFTLTPSDGTYTMGSSGDFNTTRPLEIEEATIEIQDASPYEVPLQMLSLSEWAAITDKATSTTIPTKIYIEGTNPLETINLWPVPSAANKLVLYSRKPFTNLSTGSTSVTFPPGYQRALRYNLAIELAPEYSRPVNDAVAMIAAESKEIIKRTNIKPVYLQCDEMLTARRRYNIYTGE